MLRPQRLVRPFLAFLVLGCTALGGAAVRAGDKWPVPVGPSHEPDPFHYDAKVWKDVPRDYLDDAAACILYASTSYLVEPDGTIETIVHDVTRLNGRKGIEKLGEYRNLSYDPSYETLTLNTAVIHKADGHDAPIEPRDVQLRDVSTDYQVYDHEKQLIISFPHLEVGDIFEVKWTVRGKNPEHAGQFFTRYTFGDATYPCVTDELRVRLPKSMPLKYASFVGSIEPIRTEDKDTVLYTWKSELNRQLPQDENLPSKETLFKGVACSTFPSWEAIGQWKQKLREDCWVCTGDVHQTAYDVTKGLNDPIAKARALVYWMRRNIRYVSTGEMHDYTPHKPSEILANRYGDCKDGTQLLAVMLREVGIKVELATLGAEDDGQVLKAVPSPWGTHAILVATIDGKEHWVDTTSSLAGWDFLPHDDRDRLCYVVDDKGAIRLTRHAAAGARATTAWSRSRMSGSAPTAPRALRARRDFLRHGVAGRARRLPGGPGRRAAAAGDGRIAGRQQQGQTGAAGHRRGVAARLRPAGEGPRRFHRRRPVQRRPGQGGQRRRQQGVGQVRRLQPRLRPQDAAGVLFDFRDPSYLHRPHSGPLRPGRHAERSDADVAVGRVHPQGGLVGGRPNADGGVHDAAGQGPRGTGRLRSVPGVPREREPVLPGVADAEAGAGDGRREGAGGAAGGGAGRRRRGGGAGPHRAPE